MVEPWTDRAIARHAPGEPKITERQRARLSSLRTTTVPLGNVMWPESCLAAQTQPGNELAITLGARAVEVGKHTTTLANELEQTTARVEIVLVLVQVAGQVLDAARQQGYLHLRRTRIALVDVVVRDNLRLYLSQ